jgi:hypothetical protein
VSAAEGTPVLVLAGALRGKQGRLLKRNAGAPAAAGTSLRMGEWACCGLLLLHDAWSAVLACAATTRSTFFDAAVAPGLLYCHTFALRPGLPGCWALSGHPLPLLLMPALFLSRRNRAGGGAADQRLLSAEAEP